MKKITIIIPVYNAALYLEKCLNSVINQTYTTLEIILINDGSTDDSASIVKKYKEKDNRIIAIHKPNGGIGSAYKVAFEIMTGDYVLFVDSDDWLELHAVEKLMNLALTHKADMVSFGIKPQNEKGEVINFASFDNINLINTDNESILKTHFEVLKHPTLVRLFKKHLFEGITVFEQNIGIDEMLTPQLLVNCHHAVYTTEVFYNVLVRQDSVCRAVYNDVKVLQTIKVYDYLNAFFFKQIPYYQPLLNRKQLDVLNGIIKGYNKSDFTLSKNTLIALKKSLGNCLKNNISEGNKYKLTKQELLSTSIHIFLPMRGVLSFIKNNKS